MIPAVIANAIAMLVAKLLPPVFAFGLHVSVARIAGAAMLGGYVYLVAVLMIFQAIAGAGMQFLISRDLAAFPERAAAYLNKARSFALVSGGFATAGYVLYAALLLPRALLAPALALSLTLLPSAWIAIQESVFIATRTHHRIAIVAVVENSIKLAIGLWALATGHGLFAICAGIAVARLAAFALGSWMVERAGFSGTWRLDPSAVAPFGLAVAPFAGLFIVSMTYFRIDVPIVAGLAGESMAGFYGAAIALFGAVLLLPESAMATAYPRLASTFRTSHEGYTSATMLVAKLLSFGIVPVSLGLICFADEIVAVAYGPRFSQTPAVLRLLALSLPVHALNGALGQALQAGREQRAMLGIVVSGLLVHVCLNILLVRAFGIQGSAVAMLLSSLWVAAGALWTVNRRIGSLDMSVRKLGTVLPIAGPLALAALAPGGYRLAAGALGLCWLIGGTVAHRIFARTEVLQLVEALRFRPARATA